MGQESRRECGPPRAPFISPGSPWAERGGFPGSHSGSREDWCLSTDKDSTWSEFHTLGTNGRPGVDIIHEEPPGPRRGPGHMDSAITPQQTPGESKGVQPPPPACPGPRTGLHVGLLTAEAGWRCWGYRGDPQVGAGGAVRRRWIRHGGVRDSAGTGPEAAG